MFGSPYIAADDHVSRSPTGPFMLLSNLSKDEQERIDGTVDEFKILSGVIGVRFFDCSTYYEVLENPNAETAVPEGFREAVEASYRSMRL